MSYRFMRTMVMFDLPTVSLEDKRNYRRFRKFLIENGFVMMQESIYTRILLNQTSQDAIVKLIKRNRPPAGTVQVMTVTEKQFARMEYIAGEKKTDVVNSDEKVVVI